MNVKVKVSAPLYPKKLYLLLREQRILDTAALDNIYANTDIEAVEVVIDFINRFGKMGSIAIDNIQGVPPQEVVINTDCTGTISTRRNGLNRTRMTFGAIEVESYLEKSQKVSGY